LERTCKFSEGRGKSLERGIVGSRSTDANRSGGGQKKCDAGKKKKKETQQKGSWNIDSVVPMGEMNQPVANSGGAETWAAPRNKRGS